MSTLRIEIIAEGPRAIGKTYVLNHLWDEVQRIQDAMPSREIVVVLMEKHMDNTDDAPGSL